MIQHQQSSFTGKCLQIRYVYLVGDLGRGGDTGDGGGAGLGHQLQLALDSDPRGWRMSDLGAGSTGLDQVGEVGAARLPGLYGHLDSVPDASQLGHQVSEPSSAHLGIQSRPPDLLEPGTSSIALQLQHEHSDLQLRLGITTFSLVRSDPLPVVSDALGWLHSK